MPFCYVGSYQTAGDAVDNNGTKILYRTYGYGPVKVLMINGLAGTYESWGPQIKGLTRTSTPNDDFLSAVDRDESDGVEEYVKVISASGMQSTHGFDGQVNACWRHKMHFEAVESRFLHASFSAFVDVLTLATKTIEEFCQGLES